MGGRQITGTEKETAVKAAFLEKLAAVGSAAHAARLVGVSRSTVYAWRQADNAFAQAWDDANDAATAALESGIYQRALNGIPKPVHYKGERVDEITEYSVERERLVMQMRRPELFRAKSIEEMADTQQVILQFQPVTETAYKAPPQKDDNDSRAGAAVELPPIDAAAPKAAPASKDSEAS